MKTPESIIFYTLFFLVTTNIVNAQSGPMADEYIRIADDYKKKLNPDSAIVYYEKALAEYQNLGNAEQLVNMYNQIGIILTRQDNYAKAKVYLEKALSIGLALLDTNSLVLATTYISLGVNCAAEENYDQSILYHNKALSIRLQELGEYSADVATSYGNIGNVYLRSKELDKAIDAHLQAKKIREKLFGETGVEVIQSYTNLGNAYKERKDYQVSLEYYEKALKNKILQVGEGHKDLSRFYRNVSDVYYSMGNREQGDFYKAKADAVIKQRIGYVFEIDLVETRLFASLHDQFQINLRNFSTIIIAILAG